MNVSKLTRSALWVTPLRTLLVPRYKFGFSPRQLAFLLDCLDKTRDVAGEIYEIGCAEGSTTVFLNRHLRESKIAKRYICIDTFDGFMPDDIEQEVAERHKDGQPYRERYAKNRIDWFRYGLGINGCDQATCIQADIKQHVFTGDISFCLLDVDLYAPTLVALRNLWSHVKLGGMVVVDDCQDGGMWDGAMQAYREFTAETGLPQEVKLGKLGLLRRA